MNGSVASVLGLYLHSAERKPRELVEMYGAWLRTTQNTSFPNETLKVTIDALGQRKQPRQDRPFVCIQAQ